MDKYFDHRRLVKHKAGVTVRYQTEKDRWHSESGFATMWANVKKCDFSYLRYMQEGRKYGKIIQNLQMFVDEQVWRTENKTADQKR
jgi:hypothetical protein